MKTRRETLAAGLFAGLAAAVSGASYAIAIRRLPVPLARGQALDRLPVAVGPWVQEVGRGDMVDPVVVDEAFAEALRIYDLEVERDYVAAGDRRIMLNGVYLREVTQEAKFHWPEFCYATQGFTVKRLDTITVRAPRGVIRASRFLAMRDDRRELVFYISRIGGSMPAGGREVRMAIFRNSFGAGLPDSVLLRISTLIDAADPRGILGGTKLLEGFLTTLIAEAAPQTRALLVGDYA